MYVQFIGYMRLTSQLYKLVTFQVLSISIYAASHETVVSSYVKSVQRPYNNLRDKVSRTGVLHTPWIFAAGIHSYILYIDAENRTCSFHSPGSE